MTSTLLQPDVLSRAEALGMQARHLVEGLRVGEHKSPFRGFSVEFVQHREYVPGDDVRRIDWKVWSKTDRYFIKQYEEETNLRTTLLVDVSESMQFGSTTTTKYDYACSVAAALAYLLLRQQDAVSMLAFDEEVRGVVPSRSRQTHLGAILSVLMQATPARKTDMYDGTTKDAAHELARWTYDSIAKGQPTSAIRYVGGSTGKLPLDTLSDV